MKLAVRIYMNEQGSFTAICPSLPGCCCRGTTHDEARSKIDEAVRGYIAAVNNFVPEMVVQETVEA